MSLCGATENLVELTQSIGTTNEMIGNLFDSIPISPSVSQACLLYTSPSPRDVEESRMPSSA